LGGTKVLWVLSSHTSFPVAEMILESCKAVNACFATNSSNSLLFFPIASKLFLNKFNIHQIWLKYYFSYLCFSGHLSVKTVLNALPSPWMGMVV
jgi:hypothetical protein